MSVLAWPFAKGAATTRKRESPMTTARARTSETTLKASTIRFVKPAWDQPALPADLPRRGRRRNGHLPGPILLDPCIGTPISSRAQVQDYLSPTLFIESPFD